MDENNNSFGASQSNFNQDQRQQTDSHTTPSTKSIGQNVFDPSGTDDYQTAQTRINPEQNQQNMHSNVPFYQWDSADQNRCSRQSNSFEQQMPPDAYEQQYSYETGQPMDWSRNVHGNQTESWNGQYWQNGAGFPPSPLEQVPGQPKQKMGVGVKAFIIILAVLAVGFIGGFVGFGIAVVVQQQNDTDVQADSPNRSFPQFSNNKTFDNDVSADVPDKTDPNFAGVVVSSADSKVLTPEQVYEKVSVSMVSVLAVSFSGTSNIDSPVSQGSGIVATSNGYIITNAHVIDYSKATQVVVITHDQKQYEGVVVGYDKDADLAVIKIEAEGLTPAEFGDDGNLSVGETVVAIGNPGGVRYSGSMTMGVVSALNRSVADYSSTGITYIQTDTAINPGNSGGGLMNMRGQVVGINTIKVVSSGYEGMGFSIPISQAKSILDTLIREGEIPPVGRLGIAGSTKYLPVAGETYSVAGGVRIVSIDRSSPLRNSDLKIGDFIVGFNGTAIHTLEDVYTQLKDHRVGEEITLTIRRAVESGDTTFDVQTVIMNRDSQEASAS